MDCLKVYHNLSAYLHKELLPNIRVEIDEHLRSCPHCRKHLEALKQVTAAIAESNCLKAPEGIEENVLNAINDYEIKRRKWESFKLKERTRPKWMLGFSLAVSAAVLFLGLALSSNMVQNQQYAETGNILRAEEIDSFDKSDLVLDDTDGIIRVVQDLDGKQYIVVRSERYYPGSRTRTMEVDTLYSAPLLYDTDNGNPHIVKTGTEVVF